MKEPVQCGGSKMIAPTLAPPVQPGDSFVLFFPPESEVGAQADSVIGEAAVMIDNEILYTYMLVCWTASTPTRR